MNYKTKLIVGFRRDQEHSIDINEAHKAYYLFNHPDTRSTFSNGLAIKGDQIQEIVPDYQGTMGWNPTHQLESDDYNEINRRGVSRKLRQLMGVAHEISRLSNLQDLNTPLITLLETKYPELGFEGGELKRIGETT